LFSCPSMQRTRRCYGRISIRIRIRIRIVLGTAIGQQKLNAPIVISGGHINLTFRAISCSLPEINGINRALFEGQNFVGRDWSLKQSRATGLHLTIKREIYGSSNF
jgi:hypothetical protein